MPRPACTIICAASKPLVCPATETGSSDAPSTGSPFSASPQQLRGDGGDPADDVYGLGALAHELLTRYPPFYPHFNAAQVQEQDPPRPVPVQPAPVELLDLVQAMLARDGAARPALAEALGALERFVATADMPEEEGMMVVEATASARVAADPGRAPRSSQRWWWGLLAAGAAGVAALLWLPGPTPEESPQVPEQSAPPPSVADALVVDPPAGGDGAARSNATVGIGEGPDGSEAVVAGSSASAAMPGAATPAPQQAAEEPACPTLAEELRAGQQALAAMRPAEATSAFRRALAIEGDNTAAREGLAAAVRQQELLARLAVGTRAEAAGDLEGARDLFRELLETQPRFTPARTALARVEGRLADDAFEQHLGGAAEALQLGKVEVAEQAYAQAATLRPRDARVLDGQQRIAEIHRDRRNATDLATGTELEAAERWEEAVAHYGAALEREAGLRFAQEGLVRSERRLALDRELADYQARPQRLTAPLVRQAAQRALARGTSTATAGESPRLSAQLAWLRTHLAMLDEPVRVELLSDNHTEVRVIQVGELGRFEMHELNLPPGQYTFIGQREGFRDVRVELDLAPGQREAALSVRCTEPI